MVETCSRCGRQSHVEYGSDGLAYCSSCIFYGLNKQCWKCRMYLPASELQQHRGQWICPICRQDAQREEADTAERSREKGPQRLEMLPERCERCGRELDIVYIWNNRKLCKRCVDEGQQGWGVVSGGPGSSSQGITVTSLRVGKERSIIERAFSEFLKMLGLKKKTPEKVVIVHSKMPIGFAKPMKEGKMEKKEARSKGQVEGLMTGSKEKGRKKKEKGKRTK